MDGLHYPPIYCPQRLLPGYWRGSQTRLHRQVEITVGPQVSCTALQLWHARDFRPQIVHNFQVPFTA